MVGAGARGMVGAAFGIAPEDDAFADLRDAFLARYQRDLLTLTRVFEDMLPVLDWLEAVGLPWGIVTNKAERFAMPVVEGLGLAMRARALICGDTTAHAKPHPGPLLEAARRCGVDASACAYVGDDLRDIVAGRAAGMATLAAAWGYLGQGESIDAWGADHVMETPKDLLNWLQQA